MTAALSRNSLRRMLRRFDTNWAPQLYLTFVLQPLQQPLLLQHPLGPCQPGKLTESSGASSVAPEPRQQLHRLRLQLCRWRGFC